MLDYSNITMIILFSLLALSCILTNCLICYVILKRIKADGAFKYYILSMAVTDILVGIIPIPTYIIIDLQHIEWTKKLVQFYRGADMLLGMCSMFHISLMAFDRMMAISQPLLHRLHMRTGKTALKLLSIPWILASLITAVNFAVMNTAVKNIISSATGIGVPFLFTITCYIIVFITIRKRNKHFSQNSSSSHMINEMRLLKMVFCVLAVYLMCWLPFAIVNGMIKQLMSSLEYSELRYLIYAAKFLQYLNSTCNPFVYAIFHPNYRVAVKDVLKKCCCRKETRVHNTEMQLY